MLKNIGKFRGWLCLSVLGITIGAFALDYVLVDDTVVPPLAVSLDGEVALGGDGNFTRIALSGKDDIRILIHGEGDDAQICYRLLDENGEILASGEGTILPVLANPGAIEAEIGRIDDDMSIEGEENDDSKSVATDPFSPSPTARLSNGTRSGASGFVHNDGDLTIPYGQKPFNIYFPAGYLSVPAGGGAYSVLLSCDDYATVTVGNSSFSAQLNNPLETTARFDAGFHVVHISWENIGGPYFISLSITPIEGGGGIDPLPPAPELIVSPQVVPVVLKTGGGAVSSGNVVAYMEGEDTSGYWIEVEHVDDGLSAGSAGASLVDAAKLAENGQLSVGFNLVGTNGVVSSATAVFMAVPEKAGSADKGSDPCGCNEGTKAGAGCIDFAQAFGRTPSVPGMPVGQLRIMSTMPTDMLSSPAALFYDHPMERKIEWLDTASTNCIIRAPDGQIVQYYDGKPAGMAVGLDSGVTRDDYGFLIERLKDGTRIKYDAGGTVSHIRPENAAEYIAITNLGITVLRNAQGTITNIFSSADGNLAVTATSTNAYSVAWTAPSGSFVKSFSFSRPAECEFSLHEYRNDTFNFDYLWTYSSLAQDWMLTKSPGTADELKEEKTTTYDFSSNVWRTVHGYRKGNGALTGIEETVVDVNQASPKETGRTKGGRTQYSAERDVYGRIASDVNDRGLESSYLYDGFGRMVSSSRTIKGSLEELTTNLYSQVAEGGIVDRRPIRTMRFIDGVLAEDTEYSYGATNTVSRSFGGETRTSRVEFDGLGRETLTVGEDGRATKTIYSPAGVSNAGWMAIEYSGVWSQATGFALVDGKSERDVKEYNVSGNLIRIDKYAYIGGDWHAISWEERAYNAAHKVVSSVKSNGKTSSADWICTGPVWQIGEDGILVTNIYDSTKALVSSIRQGPHGAVTTSYVRDERGLVLSETTTSTGLETLVSSKTYDTEGRVTGETDENGRTTVYQYSADGRTTTITLPSGGTHITTLNADGSVASVTGTAVTPEYHTYGVTTNGLEWTLVNYLSPNGARYVKTYRNGFGEVVREERPGANNSVLVTDYAYNNKGQLVSISTTGEPAETRTYDAWGDVVSITHAQDGESRTTSNTTVNAIVDGEVWSITEKTEYCSDGNIAPMVTTNMTQRSGLSLTNESYKVSIGKRGNLSETWSEFDPATSTRHVYSAIEEATNLAEQEETDGVNVWSVSLSAVTNTATCDAYRRITAATDGRGNTSTRAYLGGYLLSQTDGAGNTTAYVYDNAGNVSEVTNALGVVTTYGYDERGNKTYEGGGTYPATYAYDAFNVMTNMTTYRAEGEQAGDTTTWSYDPATGLLLAKTYADGNGPTYAYTDNGELSARTWARGITTAYSYDGWHNLTNVVYSDSTPDMDFKYDALGRVTNSVDAVGTTATAYDAYGEVASETANGLYSRVVSHVRDAYGRDLGYTIDNSRKSIVEYEADTARMKRVMMAGAWFTYYYLPGTDLKSRLQYGGSGSAYYTYEPNRDLLTQVRNHINGGVISQYDYVNDAAGRRTAITRSGSMMSETRTDYYGYNDRSELTNAVKNATLNEYAYQYDDIGNRTAALDLGTNHTYTANALNQYTQISNLCDSASLREEFIPTFDLDGNQTLIQTATGVWQVSYNGENRPVSWTCGATNIVMKFDRMGRRVEYIETVNGVTNTNHRFVYDGYLCIQRLNGANNNSIDLVFGWDPSEQVATRPLILQKYGAYSLFYTHDGNKNVSDLVFFQQANGVAAHYEYAPFGAVTVASRNTPVTAYDFREYNPFRFSSEYDDSVLGALYYNYRHYNAYNGRWMSRDLIEEAGGCNVYRFCGNSCVSDIDTLGLVEYSFDNRNCVLNVAIRWRVLFIDDAINGPWSEEAKREWKNKAKERIESYYSTVQYKCYRQDSQGNDACCPNGVSVSVRVLIDDNVSNEDAMTVSVKNDPLNRSSVNRRRNTADLDVADVNEQRHGEQRQVPIVHESGHMLGLHHPGGVGNAAANYNADPESLMGKGMILRLSDFNSAFCAHISETEHWGGR